MHRNWRLFIVGYLWCLPLTLGYLLFVVLPFYRPYAWKWNQGVLTCLGGTFLNKEGLKTTRVWGRPGAQTVGSLQVYASEAQRQRADLRVHETTHVVQFFIGGLLGFLAMPAVSYLLGWSVLTGVLTGGFLGSIGAGVAYGVLFFGFWAGSGFGPWHAAYRKNYFEAQAYAAQARTTDANWGA